MLCPFAQAWMMIQGVKQQQISLCYLYMTLGKYICLRVQLWEFLFSKKDSFSFSNKLYALLKLIHGHTQHSNEIRNSYKQLNCALPTCSLLRRGRRNLVRVEGHWDCFRESIPYVEGDQKGFINTITRKADGLDKEMERTTDDRKRPRLWSVLVQLRTQLIWQSSRLLPRGGSLGTQATSD